MSVRTALYARSSAALPITPGDQEGGLRQLAAERGWAVVAVHADAGMVGGKAGQRRPGQARLLHGIKTGAYTVLMVHSLHLLGRDVGDLVSLLMAIRAANVRLITIAEQIDTGDADTYAHGLLGVAGLLDAYQRFGKRERVLEGHNRARAAGVRIGRPPIPESRRQPVLAALETGAGVRGAGRIAGVSATSVLRVRDGMQTADVLAESSAD